MRTNVTHTLSHTFLFHSYVSRAPTLHTSALSPLGFSCGVCQLATMGFFTLKKGSARNLWTLNYFYSVTHCLQFYIEYMWKKIRFWVPKKMIKTYQTNSTDFWARLGNLRRKRTPRNKIQLLARTRPRCLEKVLKDQFFFNTVEYFQVKDNVNSIPNNKASGIDKVYHLAYQLKRARRRWLLFPVFTSTINISPTSGVVPIFWKIAEVCAILKNRDHEKAVSIDQFRATANTL